MFAVSSASSDPDELAFRVSQCRQSSTENAARVDAYRIVNPFGQTHRRVSVNHGRSPPIIDSPIAPDG